MIVHIVQKWSEVAAKWRQRVCTMGHVITYSHSATYAPLGHVGGEAATPPWSAFWPGLLNLLKTMIGSGVLALPFAFSRSGWALGLLMLGLSCAGAATGMAILFASAARVGGTDASFHTLALATYPWLVRIVDVIIGIKCVGVAISYLIVIGTLLPLAAASMWNLAPDSLLRTKPFWISLVGIGFSFPLSFLSNLNSLRYSSLVGLVVVVYVVVLVAVFYLAPVATGACEGFPSEAACRGDTSAGPKALFPFLQTVGT